MHEVEIVDKAVLVSIGRGDTARDLSSISELKELADTAGAEVVGEFSQNRAKPDPGTYLGQGKAEELYAEISVLDANLVIVNDELTPTQLKNLDKAVNARVIDRTQLILDIFAQRAQTSEGKLQVELAQLKYLLPRLVGLDKSLSRLGGGIGTRGPGETKLESDRRRIREKITDLTDELEDVRRHRQVQKQGRRRLPFPTAALVGYTSAGKSTLLNTLSGSDVLVDRKLFATLDPTTRRVVMPDGSALLLTDTVGFIRDLPHHLVAAFRATLEEVTDADFLVHVVDVSHPDMVAQMEAVHNVLKQLDADEKPIVTIFNKSDLVSDQYVVRKLVVDTPNSVYISALEKDGIGQLMVLLEKTIRSLKVHLSLNIPYDRSDLVNLCYESGRVLSAEYTVEGILVDAEVAREVEGRLKPYSVE